MKTINVLALAGSLMLSTSPIALAADLLPPGWEPEAADAGAMTGGEMGDQAAMADDAEPDAAAMTAPEPMQMSEGDEAPEIMADEAAGQGVPAIGDDGANFGTAMQGITAIADFDFAAITAETEINIIRLTQLREDVDDTLEDPGEEASEAAIAADDGAMAGDEAGGAANAGNAEGGAGAEAGVAADVEGDAAAGGSDAAADITAGADATANAETTGDAAGTGGDGASAGEANAATDAAEAADMEDASGGTPGVPGLDAILAARADAEAGMQEARQAIEANDVLMEALRTEGFEAIDVFAIFQTEGGAVNVYVDDRPESEQAGAAGADTGAMTGNDAAAGDANAAGGEAGAAANGAGGDAAGGAGASATTGTGGEASNAGTDADGAGGAGATTGGAAGEGGEAGGGAEADADANAAGSVGATNGTATGDATTGEAGATTN